jgi:anti-anti-sigma factor
MTHDPLGWLGRLSIQIHLKLARMRPIRLKKSSSMAIEIIIRGIEGATVVDFHGRLDLNSRWHVKAVMNQCCLTETEFLMLNLKGLTFIDSAGLGFLVICSRKFLGLNRRISWIYAPGFVGDLILNLQIQEIIPLATSEQEALSSFPPLF